MAVPLARDLAGKVIPAGKVRRVLEGPAVGAAALPSWLTAAAGTASFPATPEDWGVQLTTGTVATNSATLATAFTIDSSKFEAIRWTVEGWRFDSSTASATTSISIRNAAGDAGVTLFGLVSSGETTFRILNPGGNVSEVGPYEWAGLDATKHRNLTIEVRKVHRADGSVDRHVFVLEDDQVQLAFDVSASWNDGLLVPQVSVTKGATVDGLARWWRAGQVRLELVSN